MSKKAGIPDALPPSPGLVARLKMAAQQVTMGAGHMQAAAERLSIAAEQMHAEASRGRPPTPKDGPAGSRPLTIITPDMPYAQVAQLLEGAGPDMEFRLQARADSPSQED